MSKQSKKILIIESKVIIQKIVHISNNK